MTITDSNLKVSYVGDGVIEDFIFNMKTFNTSWIKVFENDVLTGAAVTVVLNVDQDTSPGGTVNVVPAPLSDVAIDVTREAPLDQLIDFNSYSGFPADTNELGLDKLTILIQQIESQLSTVSSGGVDLNSFPQELNYVATIAAHALTNRITYTVPVGKKLNITYITDLIVLITTGTGDLSHGVVVSVTKSGDPVKIIYQDSSGVDGVSINWEHYQIRNTWLYPGDILDVETFDLSTGGSKHFVINIAADLYDL